MSVVLAEPCPAVFSDDGELVAFCQADRDLLLSAWKARRRRVRRPRVPAEMLDEIIRDVLGFSIVYQVLPGDLMGCCDFEARRIVLSTGIARQCFPNTHVPGVVNSTLAHELGHARFPHHEREVLAELSLRADGWDEDALEWAVRRRDHEANWYARIFLVPEEELAAREEARVIEAAALEGRAVESAELWQTVLRLAGHFQVTGALMARRLEGLGWIRRCEGRRLAIRAAEEAPVTDRT